MRPYRRLALSKFQGHDLGQKTAAVARGAMLLRGSQTIARGNPKRDNRSTDHRWEISVTTPCFLVEVYSAKNPGLSHLRANPAASNVLA
jgi:hypothetical protein